LQSHDQLQIMGANGYIASAKLLGRDPTTDIAAFTVTDAESLPMATTVKDTAELKVGHLVLGLARSIEGDLRSAMGIVSVLNGQWQSMSGGTIDRFIRPDLTLYRGFAGGALIDAAGQVVGGEVVP
jgi:S1-C subfamily serine protease